MLGRGCPGVGLFSPFSPLTGGDRNLGPWVLRSFPGREEVLAASCVLHGAGSKAKMFEIAEGRPAGSISSTGDA